MNPSIFPYVVIYFISSNKRFLFALWKVFNRVFVYIEYFSSATWRKSIKFLQLIHSPAGKFLSLMSYFKVPHTSCINIVKLCHKLWCRIKLFLMLKAFRLKFPLNNRNKVLSRWNINAMQNIWWSSLVKLQALALIKSESLCLIWWLPFNCESTKLTEIQNERETKYGCSKGDKYCKINLDISKITSCK